MRVSVKPDDSEASVANPAAPLSDNLSTESWLRGPYQRDALAQVKVVIGS